MGCGHGPSSHTCPCRLRFSTGNHCIQQCRCWTVSGKCSMGFAFRTLNTPLWHKRLELTVTLSLKLLSLKHDKTTKMCFVFLAEHFGRKQHILTKFGIGGGESWFCELCPLLDIAMESGVLRWVGHMERTRRGKIYIYIQGFWWETWLSENTVKRSVGCGMILIWSVKNRTRKFGLDWSGSG
jgi:hypothetical protein